MLLFCVKMFSESYASLFHQCLILLEHVLPEIPWGIDILPPFISLFPPSLDLSFSQQL